MGKNPLIDVNVDFTENNVAGLSTHELIYIKADKAKKTIAMKIFVPNSVATGLYVIQGKVAVLELDAQPPAKYTTAFSDTTIEGVAQLKVENNKLIIDGDPVRRKGQQPCQDCGQVPQPEHRQVYQRFPARHRQVCVRFHERFLQQRGGQYCPGCFRVILRPGDDV